MTATSAGQGWGHVTAVSAALLLWGNGVVPRLPPWPWVRAGANLAATAALVAAATGPLGLSREDLGVGRSRWRAGARDGVRALAATAAGYATALAVPSTRRRLASAAHLGGADGAAHVAARGLVLSPLGTVLCEEVAFRGVLAAAATRLLPPPAATALTASVFGLWHLHHGLGADGPVGPDADAGVAATVLATAAGGLAFGWLRHRTGSLLAPAGLHLATNSLGLAAGTAAAALERRARSRPLREARD